MLGHVRGIFPRVALSLPGQDGPATIEFIVDTGFDGELALPTSLLASLDTGPAPDRQVIRLADGSLGMAHAYEILLDWLDGPRLTTVLLLEGHPLLGAELLAGCFLESEMREGGEVSIELL